MVEGRALAEPQLRGDDADLRKMRASLRAKAGRYISCRGKPCLGTSGWPWEWPSGPLFWHSAREPRMGRRKKTTRRRHLPQSLTAETPGEVGHARARKAPHNGSRTRGDHDGLRGFSHHTRCWAHPNCHLVVSNPLTLHKNTAQKHHSPCFRDQMPTLRTCSSGALPLTSSTSHPVNAPPPTPVDEPTSIEENVATRKKSTTTTSPAQRYRKPWKRRSRQQWRKRRKKSLTTTMPAPRVKRGAWDIIGKLVEH